MTEAAPAPNQQQDQLKQNRTQAQRIAQLVRSGLMKTSELPALKLAMMRHSKVGDVAKLPRNQRDVLNRYYQATAGAALATQQSTQAVRRNIMNGYEVSRDDYITEATFNDPPMMLILKRQGIRIFPDGKRVALYKNDKLGLSFTIPYSSNGPEQELTGVSEDIVLEDIEQLAEVKEGETKKMNVGGETINVGHQTAMNILSLHSKLNDDNKKQLQKHIKDPEKFKRIAKLAASAK